VKKSLLEDDSFSNSRLTLRKTRDFLPPSSGGSEDNVRKNMRSENGEKKFSLVADSLTRPCRRKWNARRCVRVGFVRRKRKAVVTFEEYGRLQGVYRSCIRMNEISIAKSRCGTNDLSQKKSLPFLFSSHFCQRRVFKRVESYFSFTLLLTLRLAKFFVLLFRLARRRRFVGRSNYSVALSLSRIIFLSALFFFLFWPILLSLIFWNR